jgi:hypothetical protein
MGGEIFAIRTASGVIESSRQALSTVMLRGYMKSNLQ